MIRVIKSFKASLKVSAYSGEIREDFYFKMNTTKYVRSPKNKEFPYTKISTSIAQLSAVEAGIMLQILSNSDDWVINKEVVQKRSGLGKVSFEKHWKHLQQLGYIITKKLKDKNGVIYYEHSIYENPIVQNSTQEIDNPYTDNRTTETHTTDNRITVTGGTNNYQVINEDQETICASGSDGLTTIVEVRPGNNNTGSNILDPDNKEEKDFQIVPHPSLCSGEVRDDLEEPKLEPQSTSSQPVSISSFNNTNSIKTEDQNNPISIESWYPGRKEISTELKEIIEDLENVDDSLLVEMIQEYYLEDLPNWEADLRRLKLHEFFKEVSKIQDPGPFEIELVTEYHNRIKKKSYKYS